MEACDVPVEIAYGPLVTSLLIHCFHINGIDGKLQILEFKRIEIRIVRDTNLKDVVMLGFNVL